MHASFETALNTALSAVHGGAKPEANVRNGSSGHYQCSIAAVVNFAWIDLHNEACRAIQTREAERGEDRMSKMDVATKFFHACEGLKGSEGCAQFVANDATFEAQSEPLAEITSVLDYCDWMKSVGQGPLVGCAYEIVASCFDENSSTALFFAIFRGTHSGDGGPVEPTGKSTVSHYVYAITVNDDRKVSRMVKIWNAPWALRELGWA